MEKARIMVPAFLRNNHALCHMCISRALIVGIRYGDSSMTNGVVSPRKTVMRRIFALMTARIIPMM